MDAYSYTSVSVEADGKARVTVSLMPDESARVLISQGRERAQISVSHCGADVLFAPTNGTEPTVEDVRVALRLAESFAAYAAEVERLHAQSIKRAESAAESAA
jgi:hypothetical protein